MHWLTLIVSRFAAFIRVHWRNTRVNSGGAKTVTTTSSGESAQIGRRSLLMRLAPAPLAGALAYTFFPKAASDTGADPQPTVEAVDGMSGATPLRYEFEGLEEAFQRLRGTIPAARVKDVVLSRVIMGGNMIGGWAHSRDLIYVAQLVQAYNTDEKVFRALSIAERAGVNTLLSHYSHLEVIKRYWAEGGKMQFIADINPFQGDDMMEVIKRSADSGASMIYVNGGQADVMVNEGKMDKIGEAVELVRSLGLPGGIGAHHLNTVRSCVDHGLSPDFWMKTFHKSNYWSYTPDWEHDNVFDLDPVATAAYMEGLEQPWIAFKILAAGAVPPDQAFRWAFEQGADFICVGMFDWQVVDNMNLAYDVFNGPIERSRPWRAPRVRTRIAQS
jgi:hypothetical protein